MRNNIIPYRKDLKEKARMLRKNSTLSEVLLWQEISQRQLGVQFHRQVPLLDYIVDFYCHELKLAIEVNGNTHEYKVSYDNKRTSRLKEAGVKVLVFDDLDVKQNIKWVVNNILEQINDNDDTHIIPSRGYFSSNKSSEFISGDSPFKEGKGVDISGRNLKLKVCGMRDPKNIEGLIDIKPDFMGFIFYAKSARFVDAIDEQVLSNVPSNIKKVGVFVNESISNVCAIISKYGLDYAQLHGDEDLNYAKELKEKGVNIIKVFRVKDAIPSEVANYVGIADYLLFDTSTSSYGGSGKKFDWGILKNENITIPFLLSGGVQIDDLNEIKTLDLPLLKGIDVNSKFEVEPGLKDLELVRQLKEQL